MTQKPQAGRKAAKAAKPPKNQTQAIAGVYTRGAYTPNKKRSPSLSSASRNPISPPLHAADEAAGRNPEGALGWSDAEDVQRGVQRGNTLC